MRRPMPSTYRAVLAENLEEVVSAGVPAEVTDVAAEWETNEIQSRELRCIRLKLSVILLMVCGCVETHSLVLAMDAEHTMRLDTAGTMRAAVKRCTETADDRRTADSMMKIFEKGWEVV